MLVGILNTIYTTWATPPTFYKPTTDLEDTARRADERQMGIFEGPHGGHEDIGFTSRAPLQEVENTEAANYGVRRPPPPYPGTKGSSAA